MHLFWSLKIFHKVIALFKLKVNWLWNLQKIAGRFDVLNWYSAYDNDGLVGSYWQ